MNTFSTAQAIQFGWGKTKEHMGYLVGLMLILFLSSIVLSSISSIRYVGFLATIAGQTILAIGTVRIILSLKRGEKLSYKALFTSVLPFWRYLGATVLSSLIIFAGVILFIIPGIIFALALMFVKYIVVDTDKGIIDSLTESARITRGKRWQLFGFVVVMVVINMLGAMLLGVGLLVTVPITLLATAYAYDELASQKTSVEEPVASSDAPSENPVGETAS